MNKEQEAKFEKWYKGTPYIDIPSLKSFARDMCESMCEANLIGEETMRSMQSESYSKYNGKDEKEPRIPEGYFKIGEYVEWRWPGEDNKWERAKIGAVDTDDSLLEIRRIPAWKPLDGESVLFRGKEDLVSVGVYNSPEGVSAWIEADGNTYSPDRGMLPYKAERQGKPWSEIS